MATEMLVIEWEDSAGRSAKTECDVDTADEGSDVEDFVDAARALSNSKIVADYYVEDVAIEPPAAVNGPFTAGDKLLLSYRHTTGKGHARFQIPAPKETCFSDKEKAPRTSIVQTAMEAVEDIYEAPGGAVISSGTLLNSRRSRRKRKL